MKISYAKSGMRLAILTVHCDKVTKEKKASQINNMPPVSPVR